MAKANAAAGAGPDQRHGLLRALVHLRLDQRQRAQGRMTVTVSLLDLVGCFFAIWVIGVATIYLLWRPVSTRTSRRRPLRWP